MTTNDEKDPPVPADVEGAAERVRRDQAAGESLAYPEYDENGNHNPVRLPASEDSEAWELEIIRDNIENDPNDPDSPIYRAHN